MRTHRLFAALGLLLALVVAGSGPIAPAVPATVAAPADQDRSTLVVAVSRDLQNLDPTSATSDGFTSEILTNIYHWLIDYKLQPDASGEIIGDANTFVGDIAESFEFSDGGRKLTFKLRPNLKFSNGDPLDAKAVKFTYNRIFEQNTTAASLTRMAKVMGADSVRVIDDLTVEFLIEQPNPLLLGNMAQYGHSILNPNVVEPHMTDADKAAHEWLKANTKGTESGPYLLASWQPGVEFSLARNPNWWGEPAKLERVVFRIVPDASTRLTLLKTGAVDIAKDIAPKDLQTLETDPTIKVYRFPSRIVSFLGMNVKQPPFDNVKVRQAISYAVPYETIIKNVLFGYGRPLTSPIPFGMPTHTDEFFKYSTDPARAKALLAEAGYPNGLQVNYQARADLAETKESAVWIKSELAKAGIDVTIQEMQGAAFTAALQKHELGFFHHPGWLSINNDPFYHVFWLLQNPCCNYTEYKNAEIDDLISKYTISDDLPAREAAAKRIQEIAVGEAAWVFLYQPDITLATRASVKGVTYYPADRYWRYNLMWKE